jgi:mRNA interferase YafQ
MLKIEQTGQFKRDYKREKKGRHRAVLDAAFIEVLKVLVNDQTLAEKYRDHGLTGNWKDYRDCHIKPDLILIYRKPDDDEVLQLVRLGSHSELGL